MKRLVIYCAFVFFVAMMFGQVPGVIVPDFEVRAKDISLDEAITVTEMLIANLSSNKAIKVVERSILEKTITDMKFQAGDWSDAVKTLKVGEALNAEILIRGVLMQLGSSISLSITIRDIKTLDVIYSVNKKYTTDNVWDDFQGIPGRVPEIANDIAQGIRTEYAKRNEEIKAKLAQQEKERKLEEDKRRQAALSIVGSWSRGAVSHKIIDPQRSIGSSQFKDLDGNENVYRMLTFYADGTFILDIEYATSRGDPFTATELDNWIEHYSGTYTREGDKLTLSWTMERNIITWNLKNKRWVSSTRSSTRSDSATAILYISENNVIRIDNAGSISGNWSKN